MQHRYTPASISEDAATTVTEILQRRLYSLIDLGLTLKHVHWNVVGPNFVATHRLMDEHVEAVGEMSDQQAERIATLGAIPNGLAGALTANRASEDYALGRAAAAAHLGALDWVYDRVIGDHREAITATAELDPVTSDLLLQQTGRLEMIQWFIRAHIENRSGELSTFEADSLLGAAAAAAMTGRLG
jgi:starvation-inducible DNA-binding protein